MRKRCKQKRLVEKIVCAVVVKEDLGVERKEIEGEKMNRKEQRTENQVLIGAVSDGKFYQV